MCHMMYRKSFIVFYFWKSGRPEFCWQKNHIAITLTDIRDEFLHLIFTKKYIYKCWWYKTSMFLTSGGGGFCSNCSVVQPLLYCIVNLCCNVAIQFSIPTRFYVLTVFQVLQDPVNVLGFEYAGVSAAGGWYTWWILVDPGNLHVVHGLFVIGLNVARVNAKSLFDTLQSTVVVILLYFAPY